MVLAAACICLSLPSLKNIHSFVSTVTDSFELATERRARERQEFEQLANEKEALRAHMEERRRREEQQQEKDEIAKMRQEQVNLSHACSFKYY